MNDVYDEILSSSDIRTILEHYGLNISKNKCTCPFHHDKHPSMSIHQNKGIAKCFSCGAGGNAISFIQKYENEINHNNIGVKEAMQKAIEIQRLNIVIPNTSSTPLTEEQKKLQKLNNILKDTISLNEHNLFLNNNESKKALEYLKNRKISLETVKQFHIGYAPANRTYTTDTMLKKHSIDDLIEIGISKRNDQNKNIDMFYERIVIPIFDQNGNPVGLGARAINNSTKPKYINTTATSLFNKSNLLFNYHKAKSYARNDEIIIVEGYMDVISAKEMKMDNVVGTMGTALTKEHINMIKKLNCEVTLCLDNDDAGKDAMARVIPELLKSNLKVNVLDISKLGDYKDFGDLQMANLTRKQIYQTKISAFTFLMQHKYIKNSELSVDVIHNIYNKMWKDGLIKDTKDTLNFKEYIINNTNYTSDEIDKIINPKEISSENRVDRYKHVFFYYYIIGLIKNYAQKNNDRILLKYIELGNLNANVMMDSLDNEKFLKDNSLTVNISSYIQDFLFKTEDYINFKNNKMFILDNLLNNIKSFDAKGNVVDIQLSIEQKELIIKQYNESFDQNIKDYIENNPDEFEEIFIANNHLQFEKLFPKTYVETLKEQALNRFKNDGVMEAVRYGLAYPENVKSAMSRQFVNNDKYKTLLVFNNTKNILGLTVDNIKVKEKEKTVEHQEIKEEKVEEKIEKNEPKQLRPASVFIKLPGNEQETSNGIYLPTENEKAVFIPKQLYKRNEQKLEILDAQSHQANMSEYEINTQENKKKWCARLSLDDFYEKYFKLYEIHFEKEVMA